jgi:hypothetical protein
MVMGPDGQPARCEDDELIELSDEEECWAGRPCAYRRTGGAAHQGHAPRTFLPESAYHGVSVGIS